MLEQVLSGLRSRRLIVLTGSREWAEGECAALASRDDVFSVLDPDERKKYFKSGSHLGLEFSHVVYSLWAGFSPSFIMSLGGLVMERGALVILSPGEKDAGEFRDPDIVRYRSGSRKKPAANYFSRFLRKISENHGFIRIDETDGVTDSGEPAPAKNSGENALSPSEAAEKAAEAVRGGCRTVFITGNRGTGKSTALAGTAKLLLEKGIETVLSAPARSNCRKIYSIVPEESLPFTAPETLSGQRTAAALIDEMSGIPLWRLRDIIKGGPSVLAGTADGYEGNARGTALRLIKDTPDATTIELTRNLRFPPDDTLREVMESVFVPADGEKPLPDSFTLPDKESLCVRKVSQDALAQDDALLGSLYELLRENHYETSPDDIRTILDTPGFAVYTVSSPEGVLLGAAVTAEEEIERKLIDDIALGRRRPRGMIVPQSLLAHEGLRDAAFYVYRRIVRIAVRERLRRQGLGSMLLKCLSEDRESDFDFTAVSFGMTEELLRFWTSAGFTAVKVGSEPDAASGLVSAIMLKPAGSVYEPVLQNWYEHFAEKFILTLPWQSGEVTDAEISLLLRKDVQSAVLTPRDLYEISTITEGTRHPYQALPVLYKLVLSSLSKLSGLDHGEISVIFDFILRHRDVAGVSGGSEREVLGRLRNSLRHLSEMDPAED